MNRTIWEQRALELMYDGKIPANAVANPELVERLKHADELERNERAYNELLKVMKEYGQ